MRLDQSARHVFRGEDGSSMTVTYSNSGEPFREGLQIYLEDGEGKSHGGVFITDFHELGLLKRVLEHLIGGKELTSTITDGQVRSVIFFLAEKGFIPKDRRLDACNLFWDGRPDWTCQLDFVPTFAETVSVGNAAALWDHSNSDHLRTLSKKLIQLRDFLDPKNMAELPEQEFDPMQKDIDAVELAASILDEKTSATSKKGRLEAAAALREVAERWKAINEGREAR